MDNSSHGTTKVFLLSKEYLLRYETGEKEQLHASVALLNERMLSLRDSGKIIGNERLAVITALNLTSDYLQVQKEKNAIQENLGTVITKMHAKVRNFLKDYEE